MRHTEEDCTTSCPLPSCFTFVHVTPCATRYGTRHVTRYITHCVTRYATRYTPPLPARLEQLATTDSPAGDIEGIGGVQLGQCGDAKHFTIDDEDAQTYRIKNAAAAAILPENTCAADDDGDDVHREDPDDEDHKDQGKEGVVYSLSSFEPQRHTDLT